MWKFLPTWFHKLGSPPHFYRWSGYHIPWIAAIGLTLLMMAGVWGLMYTPVDYQQGHSFRIIYIHVPAAMLSMSIYVAMAVSAAISLIWRMKLADTFAACCAPIGAAYTFLALVTGSIWGKPTWGAWWVWDARLTSELVLLFLYCGVMALRSALPDPTQAGRAAAVLAIVGVVNIPIIHFSVEWWNTLHQGATVTRLDKPTIDESMSTPLYLMILGYFSFWVFHALHASRVEIASRERRKRWASEALAASRWQPLALVVACAVAAAMIALMISLGFATQPRVDLAAMGSHGPYVAAAYGITIVVFLGLLLLPVIRQRRLLADVAKRARWAEPINNEGKA